VSATSQHPLLTVDIGGRRIKVGVVEGGRLLSFRALDARAEEGLTAHLADLEATLADAAADAGVSPAACGGLGVVCPGLVDPAAGRVLSTNRKYPDAVDFDFGAWGRETFGLPVRLENDAHAALLGEWRHGAASGADDVVQVMLGTGIGCSVLIGGLPLRGLGHQAGLLGGHVVVEVGGRDCTCPSRGCAEAEASTWALPSMAREDPAFPSSALAAEAVIDYRALFAHAAAGDDLAIRLRDRSYEVWNAMAVSLVHTFAPQRIVVGGGVGQGAPDLPSRMARHLREHAWTSYGAVEVVHAQHPSSAALLGIAVAMNEDLTYL
jgi:glucokinase